MKLTEGFDLLATALGSVDRLRDLILSLAMQGKLVAQDAREQPALHLLARLRDQKEELVKAGVVRRERAQLPIESEEVPFSIPAGWEWVRLCDMAWPQAGFAFKSTSFNESGLGLPLIRIRDVGGNNPSTFYSGEYREEFLVNAGDWLIGMDGDFRVAEWQGGQALLNQRVTRLVFFLGDQELQRGFVCIALQAELRKLQGKKAYTTVDHLSGGQIASRVIAVPPSAEQARIVAKVDELMRLCNELESRGRLEAEQHARLTETLFDALAASESAHALAENWSRVAANFDLLLDRPEAVDALERTVLQLAVRGLLVSADKNDEPVDVLLEHIREEKSCKIAARKANGGKTRTGILEEERPFETPTHWTWCPLSELTLMGPNNGFSPKPSPVDTGVRCLSLSATTKGYFREDCFKFVDIPSASAEQYLLKKGDLLIQRANSLDYVGMAAVYDMEDDRFMYPDLMMRLRVASKLNVHFVHMYLISNFGRQYFKGKATGTQGTMPKINQGVVLNMPIPIPPAAEQARIVECVIELRGLCASLRARLTDRQSCQARLAEVLVEQASAAGPDEGRLALAA